MNTYIAQVEDLSFAFASLLSEALGLPPDALDRFYDSPKKSMQQRCKVGEALLNFRWQSSFTVFCSPLQVVRYPPVTSSAPNSTQGVGPHYDAGFLTFVSGYNVPIFRRLRGS